ncbi:flagellar hook-associated protein FlgK [Stutzerimonas urumqiensis]|uniref:flagellar hook-associated protein FlgK n=1 Tax=Stutzerimonas urumqiensis TaxID=638269 RepID=UPI003DA3542B
MGDLLSIGLSGLRTTQTSLTVTGHNIANVNTAGFSRQQAVQATNVPQYSGAGFIGSGSQTVDVRRLASEFLTGQLRTATSENSELQAYKSQISQLDSLLSNSTTGISPAMQSFFAALQTATQDPASVPAREAVLSQAEGLAKSFNTLYDQLDQQNTLINQQLGALSGEINSLAASVAGYNEAIAKAKSSGAEPNDLIDAREEVIRKMSEMVGVQVVPQNDSSVSLFIGTGQPLVVGTTASRLEVAPGIDDPSRFQVQLASGNTTQVITNFVSGGEMGGLLAYRDTALDKSYNTLGQLALTISDTVNQQLGQGLDLAGRAGSNLFQDINEAQAAALRVLPQQGNSGSASPVLNITNTSQLGTSDYRLDYDGTSFTARRLSDNATMTVTQTGTAPGPYTLAFAESGTDQGFEVVLDTLPAPGDRFMLQPTRRGAAEIESTLQQSDQLAFAGSARAQSVLNNRGTGAIGQPALVNGPSPLVLDDLTGAGGLFETPLSLTFDAASNTFTTSTLPAGATLSYVSPDATRLVPGQNNTLRVSYTDPDTNNSYVYEFSVSGTPQNGDGFSLGFNDKAISDNRNALNLTALQTAQTIGGGATKATYNQAYGGLVERVGSLTAQVRVNSQASETVLKQSQDSRDSLAGVNLDEEAANLVKFQQYYSASAQVIQVARTLFDTLINAF